MSKASERMFLRIRINNLNKAMKDFSDEVDRWPMFYTNKQIIETFSAIKTAIRNLELEKYDELKEKLGLK